MVGAVTPYQASLDLVTQTVGWPVTAAAGAAVMLGFDANRRILIDKAELYYTAAAGGVGVTTLQLGTQQTGVATIVDATLSTSAAATAENTIREFTLEDDLKETTGEGGIRAFGVVLAAGDLLILTVNSDGFNVSEGYFQVSFHRLDTVLE